LGYFFHNVYFFKYVLVFYHIVEKSLFTMSY